MNPYDEQQSRPQTVTPMPAMTCGAPEETIHTGAFFHAMRSLHELKDADHRIHDDAVSFGNYEKAKALRARITSFDKALQVLQHLSNIDRVIHS